MRLVALDNVNPEMDIYSMESFGPMVSLFTVDSEDEAIKIANDTEYGLSAAVFTKDLAVGLRVAKQIETG
jgi:acyl-CoA reductase-like NAD-dependent aldehyde dehydrogenase